MGVLGTDTDVPVTTPATIGVKKGMVTGLPWYPCGVCGFFFPESEFEVFEGKRYCRHNRCYEDIRDIIADRVARRRR